MLNIKKLPLYLLEICKKNILFKKYRKLILASGETLKIDAGIQKSVFNFMNFII